MKDERKFYADGLSVFERDDSELGRDFWGTMVSGVRARKVANALNIYRPKRAEKGEHSNVNQSHRDLSI